MHCCVCRAETKVMRWYKDTKKAVIKKTFIAANKFADWMYAACDKNDVNLMADEAEERSEKCESIQE